MQVWWTFVAESLLLILPIEALNARSVSSISVGESCFGLMNLSFCVGGNLTQCSIFPIRIGHFSLGVLVRVLVPAVLLPLLLPVLGTRTCIPTRGREEEQGREGGRKTNRKKEKRKQHPALSMLMRTRSSTLAPSKPLAMILGAPQLTWQVANEISQSLCWAARPL